MSKSHVAVNLTFTRKSFAEFKYFKIKCRKYFLNLVNIENVVSQRFEKSAFLSALI